MAVFLSLIQQLHQLGGFEFSNLTLLVGVIVSSVMLRTAGTTPGGIIVPAFLILAAVSSLWWALTLPLVALFIAVTYKQFFSHIFLGRQPLFIMAGMSVVIMSIIGTLMQHYGLIPPSDINYPLGVILPAILGSSFNKQGVKRTFSYTAAATLVTIAIVALIYSVGLSLGHDFHELDRLIADREVLHIGWGAILSLASVIIGFAIYKVRKVKSAGYIMLPFLATLSVVSPLNFLLVIVLAIIAYGITQLILRYSLMLGIGRYSFVLALAITMVWTLEVILLNHTRTFSPFMGTSIFASLAIAVLVNEHTIYGVRKAMPMLTLSLAMMVGIELGGAYTIQSLSHQSSSVRSLTVHARKHSVPTITQELGGK